MGLETSGKYKYIRRGQPKLTVEHRLIMHQKDPRDDEENLVVHHIDGNKANNDPSNLMWMTNSEHQRLHHLDENHFPCAGEDNANYRHGMCVGGGSQKNTKAHTTKNATNSTEKNVWPSKMCTAQNIVNTNAGMTKSTIGRRNYPLPQVKNGEKYVSEKYNT